MFVFYRIFNSNNNSSSFYSNNNSNYHKCIIKVYTACSSKHQHQHKPNMQRHLQVAAITADSHPPVILSITKLTPMVHTTELMALRMHVLMTDRVGMIDMIPIVTVAAPHPIIDRLPVDHATERIATVIVAVVDDRTGEVPVSTGVTTETRGVTLAVMAVGECSSGTTGTVINGVAVTVDSPDKYTTRAPILDATCFQLIKSQTILEI